MINPNNNSQNVDELRNSHIAPKGLEDDENSYEIPIAMHSKSLLGQIEESNMAAQHQRESVLAGAQRSMLSGNADIRSIFIPRDSVRDDLNHI